MIHQSVELPISFEGGAGLTSSISREEVRFATDVPLAVGQRLAGTLRGPGDFGEIVTTLRYVAHVTAVRLPREAGGFEVEARFEHLAFARPEAVRSDADRLPAEATPDLAAVPPLAASA
jgi:hypothetical protein